MYHASHLFSLFFSLSLSLTLPIVQSNLSMLMCVGLLTIIWTVLVPQSALPIHIHTVVLRTLESYAYGYYMDCVLLFSGAILCFFSFRSRVQQHGHLAIRQALQPGK